MLCLKKLTKNTLKERNQQNKTLKCCEQPLLPDSFRTDEQKQSEHTAKETPQKSTDSCCLVPSNVWDLYTSKPQKHFYPNPKH